MHVSFVFQHTDAWTECLAYGISNGISMYKIFWISLNYVSESLINDKSV